MREIAAIALVGAFGCQFGSAGGTATNAHVDDGETGANATSDATAAGDDDGDDGLGSDGPTSASNPDSTAAVDDGPSDTGDPPAIAPWWDDAWTYRRQLTIDEAVPGALPSAYSLVAEGLDGAALIAAGKMLESGDDLRIVRWDGATSTELVRRVLRPALPEMRVWWKTQTQIVDSSFGEYWVYYGNEGAADPLHKWADSMSGTSPVYMAADDFEGHAAGECPDGWGDCAGAWSVQEVGNGKALRGLSMPPSFLLPNTPDYDDVIVHARIRTTTTQPCPAIVTRHDDVDYAWAGYGCETGGVPIPGLSLQVSATGMWNVLFGGALPPEGEWHTVEIGWYGDHAVLLQDGEVLGSGPFAPVPDSGRIGLTLAYNVEGYFDDVIVRRFVDPEPIVTVGEEATQP